MHSFYCLVGDICVLADLLEETLLGWRPVTFLLGKEAGPGGTTTCNGGVEPSQPTGLG
jgi:hypothetical protein